MAKKKIELEIDGEDAAVLFAKDKLIIVGADGKVRIRTVKAAAPETAVTAGADRKTGFWQNLKQNLKDIAGEVARGGDSTIIAPAASILVIGGGVVSYACTVILAMPVFALTAAAGFAAMSSVAALCGVVVKYYDKDKNISPPVKPRPFWHRVGNALPFVAGLAGAGAVPAGWYMYDEHIKHHPSIYDAPTTPQFNDVARGVDCAAPEMKAVLKKYPAATCAP